MPPNNMHLNRPRQAPLAGPVAVACDQYRSQGAVEDGLNRHRIALLPFDEADVLSMAAHDLVMNGFSASQFCVLGPVDKLLAIDASQAGAAAIPGALADLWLDPVDMMKLNGVGQIGMRCGSRAAALFGPAGGRSVQPDWIRPDLCRSMTRSIEQGQLILLVAAHSATQHALGARLLLSHGKHDLQTHEFSVRDPS